MIQADRRTEPFECTNCPAQFSQAEVDTLAAERFEAGVEADSDRYACPNCPDGQLKTRWSTWP